PEVAIRAFEQKRIAGPSQNREDLPRPHKALQHASLGATRHVLIAQQVRRDEAQGGNGAHLAAVAVDELPLLVIHRSAALENGVGLIQLQGPRPERIRCRVDSLDLKALRGLEYP